MVIWLGSETMFFAGLFAAYLTIRAHTPVWPPKGVELNTRMGAIFTAVLVASSATMHFATRSAERRDLKGVSRWIGTSLALGALFMGNQVYEWTNLPFSIDSHAYGSAFYAMTGFHGLHVLGGMAAMALVQFRAIRPLPGADNTGAVEALSLYWHFVDVVWIGLFALLFLVR